MRGYIPINWLSFQEGKFILTAVEYGRLVFDIMGNMRTELYTPSANYVSKIARYLLLASKYENPIMVDELLRTHMHKIALYDRVAILGNALLHAVYCQNHQILKELLSYAAVHRVSLANSMQLSAAVSAMDYGDVTAALLLLQYMHIEDMDVFAWYQAILPMLFNAIRNKQAAVVQFILERSLKHLTPSYILQKIEGIVTDTKTMQLFLPLLKLESVPASERAIALLQHAISFNRPDIVRCIISYVHDNEIKAITTVQHFNTVLSYGVEHEMLDVVVEACKFLVPVSKFRVWANKINNVLLQRGVIDALVNAGTKKHAKQIAAEILCAMQKVRAALDQFKIPILNGTISAIKDRLHEEFHTANEIINYHEIISQLVLHARSWDLDVFSVAYLLEAAARAGSSDAVYYLLRHTALGGQPVGIIQSAVKQALLHAAASDHSNVVRELLANDDARSHILSGGGDDTMRAAFDKAVELGRANVVRELLANDDARSHILSGGSDDTIQAAFRKFVELGRDNVVRALLANDDAQRHILLIIGSDDIKATLIKATQLGHSDVVRRLLANDAARSRILSEDSDDTIRAAFENAAGLGRANVIRELLANDAARSRILSGDSDDTIRAAFENAAGVGGANVIRELLANDDARLHILLVVDSGTIQATLIQAAKLGHAEIIQILVPANAEINPHVDSDTITKVLKYALINRRVDIINACAYHVKYIVLAQPSYNAISASFNNAVSNNDVDLARALLQLISLDWYMLSNAAVLNSISASFSNAVSNNDVDLASALLQLISLNPDHSMRTTIALYTRVISSNDDKMSQLLDQYLNIARAKSAQYKGSNVPEIIHGLYGISDAVIASQVSHCLSTIPYEKHAISGCLYSWEDVDQFNTEEINKRDYQRIKIDSKKFLNVLKHTQDNNKAKQLLELAQFRVQDITDNCQYLLTDIIRSGGYNAHKLSQVINDAIDEFNDKFTNFMLIMDISGTTIYCLDNNVQDCLIRITGPSYAPAGPVDEPYLVLRMGYGAAADIAKMTTGVVSRYVERVPKSFAKSLVALDIAQLTTSTNISIQCIIDQNASECSDIRRFIFLYGTFSGQISSSDNSVITLINMGNNPVFSRIVGEHLYYQKLHYKLEHDSRFYVIGQPHNVEKILCANASLYTNVLIDYQGGPHKDNPDIIDGCVNLILRPNTSAIVRTDHTVLSVITTPYQHQNSNAEVTIYSGYAVINFADISFFNHLDKVVHDKEANSISLAMHLGQNATFIIKVWNVYSPKLLMLRDTQYPLIILHLNWDDNAIVSKFTIVIQKNFSMHNLHTESAIYYRDLKNILKDYEISHQIRNIKLHKQMFFGSQGKDIIHLDSDLVLARGGEESDVYLLQDYNKNRTIIINNSAIDKKQDILKVPFSSDVMCGERVHHTALKISLIHKGTQGVIGTDIVIQHYFLSSTYQHFILINHNHNSFIPFLLNDTVVLVPFCMENQTIILPTQHMELAVVHAHSTTFKHYKHYKHNNDLIIRSDDSQACCIIVQGFYAHSISTKRQNFKLYPYYNGEIDYLNALNMELEAQHTVDYINFVAQYFIEKYVINFSESREIRLNNQMINNTLTTSVVSPRKLGLLLLQNSLPQYIKAEIQENDLLLHHNTSHSVIIKSWCNTTGYGAFSLEFDTDLVLPITIKRLYNNCSNTNWFHSIDDAVELYQLNKALESDVGYDIVHLLRCAISIANLNITDAHKALGFRSLIEQNSFIQNCDYSSFVSLQHHITDDLLCRYNNKLLFELKLQNYNAEEMSRYSNVINVQFRPNVDKIMQTIHHVQNPVQYLNKTGDMRHIMLHNVYESTIIDLRPIIGNRTLAFDLPESSITNNLWIDLYVTRQGTFSAANNSDVIPVSQGPQGPLVRIELQNRLDKNWDAKLIIYYAFNRLPMQLNIDNTVYLSPVFTDNDKNVVVLTEEGIEWKLQYKSFTDASTPPRDHTADHWVDSSHIEGSCIGSVASMDHI